MDPQIRKLFRDVMFDSLLQGDKKKAWVTFRLVPTNFFGNIRAEKYKQLIEDMLSLYHILLQYVLKDTHATFPLGFLPTQLRRG